MYEFDAIGTHWWCEILDGADMPEGAKRDFEKYTAEFDRLYSRFREDSLITELTRTGKLNNPPQEFLDMLDYAENLKRETDGAFDVMVGNDLQRLGYKGVDARSELSSRSIKWSPSEIAVPVGIIVDLGGIAKGWMIDRYAEIMREYGVDRFIINGGGDLYCQSDNPVEFALEHPYDPKQMIGTVNIVRGALAASSVVKRSWRDAESTMHHIVDPMTHEPTNNGVVASFVVADNALIADSLATVLIVRPELEAKLKERYDLETYIIRQDQLVG